MEFSSHSFRSTSVTAMAENGASVEQMMMHGNWQSESIMRGYIRNTKRFRVENAQRIIAKPFSATASSSSSTSASMQVENPVLEVSKENENPSKSDGKEKEEIGEESKVINFASGCSITNCKIIVNIKK